MVQHHDDSVPAFYREVGRAVLQMAVGDHSRAASAEHRLRVVEGMDEVLDEMEEQFPPGKLPQPARVVCLGGKWEVDRLAARMVAHCLELEGHAVQRVGGDVLVPQNTALRPQLLRGDVVCVPWMSSEPQSAARNLSRRIRRAWPHARIVMLFWNLPGELSGEEGKEIAERIGADLVVASLNTTISDVRELLGDVDENAYEAAAIPKHEEKRLKALDASGALHSARFRDIAQQITKRAVDIFDMPLAGVTLLARDEEHVISLYGGLRPDDDPDAPLRRFGDTTDRAMALGAFVIADDEVFEVPDLQQDPRFAGNPAFKDVGARFYAGAPIRDKNGHAIGVLCLVDSAPREFGDRDLRLLQAMANDVMMDWKGIEHPEPELPNEGAGNSATLGQAVPR